MKAKFDFYLGDISNENIPFLKHIMTNTNLNVLEIMEKLEIGDPNRIYIAKILFKKKKIKNFKFGEDENN